MLCGVGNWSVSLILLHVWFSSFGNCSFFTKVYIVVSNTAIGFYRATRPGYKSGYVALENNVWGQFDLDWNGQDFIDPFSVGSTTLGEPWVRIKIEHT